MCLFIVLPTNSRGFFDSRAPFLKPPLAIIAPVSRLPIIEFFFFFLALLPWCLLCIPLHIDPAVNPSWPRQIMSSASHSSSTCLVFVLSLAPLSSEMNNRRWLYSHFPPMLAHYTRLMGLPYSPWGNLCWAVVVCTSKRYFIYLIVYVIYLYIPQSFSCFLLQEHPQ